jgi:hypothetical protein
MPRYLDDLWWVGWTPGPVQWILDCPQWQRAFNRAMQMADTQPAEGMVNPFTDSEGICGFEAGREEAARVMEMQHAHDRLPAM